MAASATFALRAGVWFRRGRLLIVSPDSLGTACPLSGRNSTYRPVQILEAGSVARQVANERLVDFYLIEAETLEVIQTGIAGPEIIHRDFYAEISQLIKNRQIDFCVLKKDRFSDLDFQPSRRQSGSL